ncbi:hypothetical protein GCM10009863_22720 [Streptomyces axinellae]|uniref:Transposase n=1 Tax=Streptomyces axinellae TaxID=552788 RepID=A0ABP6CC51_9ACTN
MSCPERAKLSVASDSGKACSHGAVWDTQATWARKRTAPERTYPQRTHRQRAPGKRTTGMTGPLAPAPRRGTEEE